MLVRNRPHCIPILCPVSTPNIAGMTQARRVRPSVAIESERHTVLSKFLPAIVHSRIPRLPSLRRSLTSVSFSGKRPMQDRWSDRNLSGSASPPPRYSQKPSHDGFVVYPVSDAEDSEGAISEGVTVHDRPSSSSNSPPPPFKPSEPESGIIWKYANQGTY